MAEPTPTPTARREAGSSWRRWALIAAIALLLLFMALNSQKVEVNLIFGSAEMPLIFALLIAACLGALVGWVVPKVRRPRQ
jgi:uncharacterized integral membrane protein